MPDTVIIGGGVIGLTTAYELAKEGVSVTLVDRQRVGEEASWAGAGMLPPGECHGPHPLRLLSKKSAERWSGLTKELYDLTGIDNGYRNCSAIQVSAQSPENIADEINLWNSEGVPTQTLHGAELQQFEPALSDKFKVGYRLPTMSQVRNPYHLKALKSACESLGVEICEMTNVEDFEINSGKLQSVISQHQKLSADQFVLAAGSWSGQLAAKLNLNSEITPVRGQIVLMKLPQPLITHILEDGPRYLVPREDGYLLIGSTQEEVGFVKGTTPAGISGLIDFAVSLVPELSAAEVVKTWSGLRPRADRGYPYIGRAKHLENLVVATGHFRDGLAQSPMTAILVADLVQQRPVSFDLGPLSSL